MESDENYRQPELMERGSPQTGQRSKKKNTGHEDKKKNCESSERGDWGSLTHSVLERPTTPCKIMH